MNPKYIFTVDWINFAIVYLKLTTNSTTIAFNHRYQQLILNFIQ